MSLTPDIFFNGISKCTACEKPMLINDVGVVYNPDKAKDFLFCMDCATAMTMSTAQDISKLADGNPDIAFNYYSRFRLVPTAASSNLRRHSEALTKLAAQMAQHANDLDLTRGN